MKKSFIFDCYPHLIPHVSEFHVDLREGLVRKQQTAPIPLKRRMMTTMVWTVPVLPGLWTTGQKHGSRTGGGTAPIPLRQRSSPQDLEDITMNARSCVVNVSKK